MISFEPDSFTLSANRLHMDDDKNLRKEEERKEPQRPTEVLNKNVPDPNEAVESKEEKMKKLTESGPKDALTTPDEP